MIVPRIVPLALLVALLIFGVLFVGVGFGTGALDSTQTITGTGQAQYTVVQANSGQSWGDGLSWAVTMTNVAQSGNAPITAMLPGYQSTSVSFGLNMYSTGDCGHTGWPTFAPGYGDSYGFFAIQYLVSGSTVPLQMQLDGAQVATSNSGNYYAVSANNTGNPVNVWCWAPSSDNVAAGLGNAQLVYFTHTLSLTGIYSGGTLVIQFILGYDHCTGTASNGPSGACGAARSAGAQAPNGNTPSPNGGALQVVTQASATVMSAGASVQVLNQGSLYNGGTLQTAVTTGYDGPNGYTLEVLCPQPRACGGSPDPAYPAQNVPNFIVGQRTFSWSIPSAYALKSSTPLINNVVVVLLANYGVVAQSLSTPVTISPLLNPAAPIITASSSDGKLYPGVGATLTFTVYANSTSLSGPISNISLEVFYMQNGQSASTPPACGSSWVTGCPYGQVLATKLSGVNGVATYSFQVQPPAGAVAIGAAAVAYAGPGSANISAPFFLQIRPAGCLPGTSCDPSTSALGLWSWLGPLLLSAMLVDVALLLALVVPLPTWGRIAVVVATGGGVVLLYVLGIYASAFSVGGLFG